MPANIKVKTQSIYVCSYFFYLNLLIELLTLRMSKANENWLDIILFSKYIQ